MLKFNFNSNLNIVGQIFRCKLCSRPFSVDIKAHQFHIFNHIFLPPMSHHLLLLRLSLSNSMTHCSPAVQQFANPLVSTDREQD